MKRCPICESTYDDSVDFCFKDGAPLDAVVDDAPAAPEEASAPAAGIDEDDLMPPDAVSLSSMPAVDPDSSVDSLTAATDVVDAASLPSVSALDTSEPGPEDIVDASLPPDASLDIAGIDVVKDSDPDASSDVVDPFGGEQAQRFRQRMVVEGKRPGAEDEGDTTTDGEESAATQQLPPVADRSADASADEDPTAADAKAPVADEDEDDKPAPLPKTAPPPPKSSPGRPGPTISARKPESESKKGGFPIGLVAAAAVIAVVLFFVFGRGGDAPDGSSTPVAERASTPEPTVEPPRPSGGEAAPDEPEIGGEEERADAGEQPEPEATPEEPEPTPEEPAVAEPEPTPDAQPQVDPAAEARRRQAEAARRDEQRARREAARKAAEERAAQQTASSSPQLPFETGPTPTPTPTPRPQPAATPAPSNSGVAAASNPWGASAPAAQPAAKGNLKVNSTPAGASITVDGTAKGKTPAQLELTPGTHEVRIALAEHATQTRVVRVESGGSSQLSVSLESLAPKAVTGSLNVITPTPAQLSIDGVARGRTPLTVTLPAGSHTFRLVVEGQAPYEETVNVQFDADGKATRFFNVAAGN